jgi:peptide/nickel transport system permease protein
VRLLRYTLRRLLMLIPVLLGVSIFTFVLIRILPGDPIRTLLPQTATPADIAAARARYGLDHPIFTQYWIFLKGLVHGNLGSSFQTGAPVTRELSERLGPTFELVTCSLVLALVLGVTLGVASALRRGGLWDQVVRFGSLAGGAVSEFWLGLLLILLFYYRLGLAPAPNGRINTDIQLHTITHIDVVDAIVTGNVTALRSVLAHLALPVITLTVVSSAPIVGFAGARVGCLSLHGSTRVAGGDARVSLRAARVARRRTHAGGDHLRLSARRRGARRVRLLLARLRAVGAARDALPRLPDRAGIRAR